MKKLLKMKKIIYLLLSTFVILTLSSCEDVSDVKEDINDLRDKRTTLRNEVNSIHSTISQKRIELNKLDEEIKEKKILTSGKTPLYVLKLKLKQSHVSLDLMKHAKDEMNAIEFEMPVNKEFYESLEIGSEIIDEFRSGSFILKGSFGNWEMTVIDKEIR